METSIAYPCPRLACSAQQNAEAASATARAQVEGAAYRTAGSGLGLGLARTHDHSEEGAEASAGGQYPSLDRGNHVRRHLGGEEGWATSATYLSRDLDRLDRGS